MEIFKIVTLSLSGLLLLFVGLMRLSNPIKAYLKNSGIELKNDVNLLNELRGVSAVMLSAAIIVALGIVIPELSLTSFVVGALIFIGFLIGRLISVSADGKPNKQIIQGMVFEVILGGINLACLILSLM